MTDTQPKLTDILRNQYINPILNGKGGKNLQIGEKKNFVK